MNSSEVNHVYQTNTADKVALFGWLCFTQIYKVATQNIKMQVFGGCEADVG